MYSKMALIKVFIVITLCLELTNSSSILLAPTDVGYISRTRNMLKLGRLLLQSHHEVTVIFSDRMEKQPLFLQAEGADFHKEFNVLRYKTPAVDPESVQSSANQDWLDSMIYQPYATLVQIIAPVWEEHLRFALEDKDMWIKIASSKYDLIVTDEVAFFTRVVSAYFDIPLIMYSNWGPMSLDADLVPRYSLAYVHSFVPPTYSDEMTFTERFMNVFEYCHVKWIMYNVYTQFISLCREHGYGEACDNIRDAHKTLSLYMMTRNDAVHYPAPYMPHVISTEGFFLNSEVEPLEPMYTDIIRKAGENGIIVVSLGSMLRTLGDKMREDFAKAFASMPHTVIWSYEGPIPKALGNNTIVNPWIPQESLLANPSTKLFVTHCGVSGTFQALHYALPTVGIPFFWDQPFYCHKLTHRLKSGKTVLLTEMTSEKLRNAMQEVIDDKRYKHNANKAADIYHSQPIDPKKKVIYWIEYVIKHKGAPHLRSKGENELNIFQYFLLDIIALVLSILIVFGFFTAFIVKYLIKCTSQYKRKQD